jgi:hypothetical protein
MLRQDRAVLSCITSSMHNSACFARLTLVRVRAAALIIAYCTLYTTVYLCAAVTFATTFTAVYVETTTV